MSKPNFERGFVNLEYRKDKTAGYEYRISKVISLTNRSGSDNMNVEFVLCNGTLAKIRSYIKENKFKNKIWRKCQTESGTQLIQKIL